MNIKKAKYCCYGSETDPSSIRVELNDSNAVLGVPLDPANTDYQAIQEWAKIDGNTIEDAD
jgi:hypothetical protein